MEGDCTATGGIHVLSSNGQIVKYTMEGRCVISVKCTKPDGCHDPSGIAVHPSGKVIVAGRNSCIQVLNPDLTHSHSFGICSHSVSESHMASDGVVYM